MTARRAAPADAAAPAAVPGGELVARLLDTVGDGWWDWDMRTGRVVYSEGWCRALGFDPGAVEQTKTFWWSRLHPDDRERVAASLAAHVAGETASYECGYRVRDRVGEYRWTLSRGIVVEHDGAGKAVRMIGTNDGLVDRASVDREIAASERRFRELAEGSVQGLVIHRDGVALFANHALADILGYDDPQQLVGMRWFDTIAPHDRGRVVRNIEARAAGMGAPNAYEYDALRRDGSTVTLHVVARVVDWDGAPAVQAALIDVTERVRVERALAESESRFRQLAEGSVQGILVHREWEPLYANRALADMLGFAAPRDLLAADWAETIAPHERERLRRYSEARIRGEAVPDGYEYEAVRRDGSSATLFVAARRVTWDGEPAIQAAYVDITERARAERALAASEARFRSLVEGSLQGVLVHRGGRPLFVNDALAAILGYERAEQVLALEEVAATVAPHDRDRLRGYGDARQRGDDAPGVYEFDAQRADGGIVRVETRVGMIEWDREPAVLATVVDVSERRRAADALAASEARFRALVDHLPAAVFLKDPEHGYVLVNRTACEWNRRTAQELLGRSSASFLDSAAARRSRTMDAELIASGRYVRYQTETVYGDGKRRVLEIIKFPIYAADGGIALIGSIDIDITDQHDAERARRELEAELQRSQKLQAVGQLTGGIAHDFNNLLGVILGYVGLALERGGATGKLEEYLDQIRVAGERGRDLVSKMLTFSRGGGGEARPLDPLALAEGCVKLLRSTLPSTVDLAIEPAGDVPRVLADPVLLEQVMVNLCINARDATKGHGRIAVAVCARDRLEARCSSCRQAFAGDFVEIAVRDTGHGIAPENAERVFDPFFTTKEVGRGTGLGLSVVHGIVHESGGHVGAEPAPEGGTVMRVWLPRTRIEDAGEGEVRRAPRPSTAPRAPAGEARVLVVDDEPALAALVGEVLEGAGHRATVTTRPEDALRAFLAAPYAFDLLVTDQTMPRLGGVDLARACLEVRPDMPVALCTGYSEDVDAARAHAIGIRWYLPKPVDRDALASCVRSALGRAEP